MSQTIQKDLHIVLDNIRSAFNVGSIFRTADAAGVSHIHLCGISPDITNPKIHKTALGATKMIPSTHYPNTLEALKVLKAQGYKLYALELTASAKHFQQIDYPQKLALVVGHEIKGVDQQVLDFVDETIYIPMRGDKESLNVANSAAIAMYECMRGVI